MENLKWNTYEYLFKEKSADWYWIVGIVTISIAVIAIILNNIIFAILIIVSSFTLSLFASKKPEIIPVEITDTGIILNRTYYPYTNLSSFWVETRENYPKIVFKSKKIFMPFIVVLIEDVATEDVHRILSQHLPEEENVEPFLEKLLAYFGF